jgi:peptidoglycan/xylan/chitin deacetylase (PgdA/CDA1 family)
MKHLSATLTTLIAVSFIFVASAFALLNNTSAFAATAPDTSGKVSFTFDDGLSSALLGAQALQPYGYVGTDYIITHCVGMIANAITNDCAANTAVNYMSWDDIATLHQTYGWEIGSHTVTHPLTAAVDNPSLTDLGLDDEMSQSQLTLQQHGYPALDFASPYGDYDNRSLAVEAKYYNSHRTFQDYTYTTDPITNTFPYYSPRSSYPYNNYLLTVLAVQGNIPVATVEADIALAKANNQWLILVFHEIKADNDPTYDASEDAYEYKAGDLASIAAYVKSESMPVVTIANGLASGTNLMPNSGFNDGIADGWTTDSPTTITSNKQTTSLAGHGSFDGSTTTGALNSIAFTGSAADTHLFSPAVTVTPGTTYTLTNFVNLTSTSGEVDFYIDEYSATGAYIAGHYIAGITGSTDADAVQVGDVNFLYTPSATTVASARLQVIVHGAGASGYLDNLDWLSPDGVTIPPVVTPPTVIAGDVNGDGTINALDLSTVLSNWNKTGQTLAEGDLNGDGTVNALDLSIVLSNWSK